MVGLQAKAPSTWVSSRLRLGWRDRTPVRVPGQSWYSGYVLLLPAFAIYAVVVLFPLGQTAWLSFFSWDGITAKKWVGIANYRGIVHDPALAGAFEHSGVLWLFYAALPVALGLLLAAILSRRPIRGLTAFRTIFFLPYVIPTVAVGVAWSQLYAPSGPINAVLRDVELGFAAKPWLGSFSYALPAVGLVGTWVLAGLTMMLFLAGVSRIPASLYEAARVDGAGPVREFFAVTLPGLRGEVMVGLTITTIGALQNFALIYVMTSGGPGYSTTVPAFEVYQEAFVTSQIGSAAAVAVTLGVLTMLVVALIRRIEGARR